MSQVIEQLAQKLQHPLYFRTNLRTLRELRGQGTPETPDIAADDTLHDC